MGCARERVALRRGPLLHAQLLVLVHYPLLLVVSLPLLPLPLLLLW